MIFKELGLSEGVVQGVTAMGFAEATPIQLRAIPAILAGKDVIGSAQTGTGKTAAFSLPILSKLGKRGKLRCLILEPTRELAAQVETAVRDYSRFLDLRAGVVFGGVGYGKQKDMLSKGVDVLVATPGRLLDFLEQGLVRLDEVEYLVLDEMDRMLDMGFMPDVRKIVNLCKKREQTMLFTATMPPEIVTMTKWVLNEPEVIEIGISRTPAETVRHALYPVAREQKFELLHGLLHRTDFDSVIIFTRTKHEADRIATRLKKAKHSVAVLHSNRTQRERLDALDGFKSGRYEVMVATDIASRGLDIAGVTHVINYDVPEHPEDYVHRIGRTGRAQAVGDAFTLFTAEDLSYIHSIERFIGMQIHRLKLDDFEYVYTAILDDEDRVNQLMSRSKSKGRRSSGGRRRR